MGYYTRYSLTTDMENETPVVETLKELDLIGWALTGNLETAHETKWYEHESDMKAISERFPDVHFTLSGEGEEQGDIWEKQFVNLLMRS